MAERPSPYQLWQQAGGDTERYRQLLREHGHLVDRQPGDTTPPLPCGWPHTAPRRRSADAPTNPAPDRPH